MNSIQEYYSLMESGEVVVSKKIRRVYKFLTGQMKDPLCEYEYNERRANHAVFFIEKFCKHSKGKMGGKPLLLELWEKAMICAMFGFAHKIDGTRQFQEVILIVARKNGKSTLAAAIALYLMIADQEPGAEIYAVATKKDQAKIIWLEAKRMVHKSPILRRKIKTLVAEMNSSYNDSTFKPLGSDSDTLDGLNVHGATMDEIHAWKDKNLYDVIVDGTSAREQAMIFITTTAGTIREAVYDDKYAECENIIKGYDDKKICFNDRKLPLIYELDKRDEWTDETKWIKANPGLGTIKNQKTLAKKVQEAKADPKLIKNLLCKDFNIRETSTESWLEFEELNNEAIFDVNSQKPCYVIGGADLSSTTDMTAAVIIYRLPEDETLYVLQMYWLPEELLEKRSREDKIPYQIWKDIGILRTCAGHRINYRDITAWFMEMREKYQLYINWVGYDPWGAPYWKEDMENNLGPVMQDVRQGKPTLSNPMKNMGADIKAHKINYGNNPIMKWCMSNVTVDIDKNGNIQPCKPKNQRARIDGFAALLDAYTIYERHMEEYANMVDSHIED